MIHDLSVILKHTHHPLGLATKTPLAGDVRFGAFPDGTIYTSTSTLFAKAKKVNVVVENSGYRRLEAR